MVHLQPVDGVGDQEGLHLALAEVENARRPVRMLVHHRVGHLIAAGAVKFIQAVFVLREVGRHPVEQDADASLMAAVDEFHELLRLAVARGRGIIARDLIAPRGIVGVFRHRHQLDVRIAHLLQVGNEQVGHFLVIMYVAVPLALPRAEVHLIDVHRAVEELALALLAAVGGIAPGVALERADDAGVLRRGLHPEAVGVGLIDGGAVGTADKIFIRLSLPRIGGECLPDAVFDPGHRHILGIPEVPVARDADALRVRRPDAEDVTVYAVALFRMAAEEGIGVQLVAVREAFDRIEQVLFHCLPP